MDAVVMAAGEGRRLRPITEHWPKPILPIDGRPVIVTLLEELADAGCPKAWVVIGHLGDQVVRLIDDNPRIPVAFVRQPGPDGSADAVRRALEAGARPPVLVSAADTVFRGGDVRRVASVGEAAVAWRQRPRGKTLQVVDGRVTHVDAGPSEPHFAAPLWIITDEIASHLENLPGPPYELKHAFQRAIDAGTTVTAIEVNPTRDLTEPADLVRHNFLYLGAGHERDL